jgi:hypothetical protein
MEAIGILKKPKGKIGFSNPETQAALDRYLKASDYQLECTEVVGKKFESIEDHARYLREGGCSKIIESLSST